MEQLNSSVRSTSCKLVSGRVVFNYTAGQTQVLALMQHSLSESVDSALRQNSN